MHDVLNIISHLPEHLHLWADQYGAGLYLILGLIVFAETGLVVTPFLPGDSLLFATGAVLAMSLPGLNLTVMGLVLLAAALTGDAVNYHVGRWLAPKIFNGQTIRGLNPKHLEKTHAFYEKHGGKTIVLARFLPIVRTYAPFVAGLSGVQRRKFFLFSFAGGTIWIFTFLNLGYFFGNIPAVKRNFEFVILGIILVSIAPLVIEYLKSRSPLLRNR